MQLTGIRDTVAPEGNYIFNFWRGE